MSKLQLDEKRNEQKLDDRFDRSDLMSALAVIISIGALLVSLYQAKILRNQQQIMQDQQKASVWPYLEANYKYQYSVTGGLWEIDLKYDIENKGVGPAKIEDSRLEVLGKEVGSYAELTKLINSFLTDSLGLKDNSDVQISYGRPSGILSKDESFQFLQIKIPGLINGSEVSKRLNTTFAVCFCSIYGDCWTLKSNSDGLLDGCQLSSRSSY
jgi:hypothetical protein